jgi:NADPH-dependent 2,4-dienoyl-CoA reductase/sulfur reductase-like enzyme/nitrite reductase/ring-hydroxylating ferredoxin subunit
LIQGDDDIGAIVAPSEVAMTETAANGPDLTQGVPVSDFVDGTLLAGHVGEEAVVLTRAGDEFFAISAHCSHYNGPLAEGLVVGDTIHCPWHHACFSLRTGNAIAAPALRPLEVFRTTVAEGVVRVDVQPSPPSPVEVRPGSERIVIVGTGAAGSFAAHELRRLGYAGPVTLLTREDRLPYDRPNLSKDYLAGRAPQDWIPLRTEAEYAEDKIDLRLSAAVDAIDTASRNVRLVNGETLPYDRLILATGATPRHLELKSDGSTPIHYLRTWADSDSIIQAARDAHTAVVIGTSFIGLEVAASLRERGLDVTVVGPDPRPLEKQLGSAIAEFVRRTHEDHGVRFHLGSSPIEIARGTVRTDDGAELAADLVVAGIGVTPDLALAQAAGLTIDNGIVVDEFLQTSVPGIFAAGDIARFPSVRNGTSIRIEHWVAAARLGQCAARNAIGMRQPFTAVPFFWSQHYDLTLAYVGHATRTDNVEILGSLPAHNAAAIYRENGHITAVATLFRDDISLAVEMAMERNESDAAIEKIVRDGFSNGSPSPA